MRSNFRLATAAACIILVFSGAKLRAQVFTSIQIDSVAEQTNFSLDHEGKASGFKMSATSPLTNF